MANTWLINAGIEPVPEHLYSIKTAAKQNRLDKAEGKRVSDTLGIRRELQLILSARTTGDRIFKTKRRREPTGKALEKRKFHEDIKNQLLNLKEIL